MLELQIKMLYFFGYFDAYAILCQLNLVCCKYFMMKFIIWYYHLLCYEAKDTVKIGYTILKNKIKILNNFFEKNTRTHHLVI